MSSSLYPPPPAGYASWLDYAVETFDTRDAAMHALFDEGAQSDREAMREAARAELRLLRCEAPPLKSSRPAED